MIPPLVSFVTWNRMGLSVRNLKALLNTRQDFELNIIDSNSEDDTWDFICELKDDRIKSKVRLDLNRGPVYAGNYNLSRRREGQYFITVDSDVNIHTHNWIDEFINTFKEFPEIGLLGAVSPEYYSRYKSPLTLKENANGSYLKIHNGFVEGCCQCFRPELLDVLGYWSEENCMGDVEICDRIINHTSYTAGFIPSVEIDQKQKISCSECHGKEWCGLDKNAATCFDIWKKKYANSTFKAVHGWKYERCMHELKKGSRLVYCASVHDKGSMEQHAYNKHLAEENFNYYATYMSHNST